jgi:hypothetical protein
MAPMVRETIPTGLSPVEVVTDRRYHRSARVSRWLLVALRWIAGAATLLETEPNRIGHEAPDPTEAGGRCIRRA